MKLPNGGQAFIDATKVRDYALNPAHPEGKHKARVFASALGVGPAHSGWLIVQLGRAAIESDCTLASRDEHGQRYLMDFVLVHAGQTAPLRCVWIIGASENFPRLVSCYVLT